MGFLDLFKGSVAGMGASLVDFGLQGLANSIFGLSKAQRQQNEFNSVEAARARDFSAQQAELSRDWQEEIYGKYNSLQGKIQQARLSGVNPMFAVTGSATSPMSAQSPNIVAPSAFGSSASPVGQISDITSAALGFSKLKAEIDNLKAHTRRENGEAFLLEIKGKYADSMESAKLSEIIATANRMDADSKYILAATEQVFANIGKIYAETAESEERTKLVSEQILKCISDVANINADTELKHSMLNQIGAQIRNLDADTQYKTYLAGLACEQQLTEMSKREEIDAHISWLSEDINRLMQVTTNAEAEEVLLKMEKDIKDWQTKQSKRDYKWSPVRNSVGMVTDVVMSVFSIFSAVKGLPFAPFTYSSTGDSTVTHIDGNEKPKHNRIGFK